MSKCVNEKCKKDPTKSMYMVVATMDGDLACCPECLEEFKKQRDHFFNNIGDDQWYDDWMKGRIEY